MITPPLNIITKEKSIGLNYYDIFIKMKSFYKGDYNEH